jgi:hypothetical protein
MITNDCDQIPVTDLMGGPVENHDIPFTISFTRTTADPPTSTRDNEDIVTPSAIHTFVVAVVVTPIQSVVAISTLQIVVSGAAKQGIIAFIAFQMVVPIPALYKISGFSAPDGVIARSALQGVTNAVVNSTGPPKMIDPVVARPPADQVTTAATVDCVTPIKPQDGIAPVKASDTPVDIIVARGAFVKSHIHIPDQKVR